LYDANNAVYLSDVLNIKGARDVSSYVSKPSETQQKLLEENSQLQHTTVSLWGDITLSMLVDEEGKICNFEIEGRQDGSILKSNDNTEIRLCWYDGEGPSGSEMYIPLEPSSATRAKDDGIGIFGGTGASFSALGKLLGLDSTFSTKQALLDSLNKSISEESADLSKILSRKLGDAGLGDVTKKITFAEDKDGNIIVKGNISAKKKKELAKIINDDPELVERIKTQKAKMEIAEGLKKDEVDLSNKKFDAARTQLLKSFLKTNKTTLDEVEAAKTQLLKDGKESEQYKAIYDLLRSFPEIEGEIQAYKERTLTQAAEGKAMSKIASALPGGKEESDTVRSLLSMKRGELSEAVNDERNLGSEMFLLRNEVSKLVHASIATDGFVGINEMYRQDPSSQIEDFNMRLDSEGRLRITDVRTKGDDPHANAIAERILNSWLTSEIREMGKELAEAMFEAHDDEHGDVKEFKHEIINDSFAGTKIISPDADMAAMGEIAELTQDIGSALGNFFGKTMGIESPFALMFGNDGLLSLGEDGALSVTESEAIKKVLDDINRYFAAEEAGEDTEGMLSAELTGVADKFAALKEAQGKIHDKSLLPKEGTRFAVVGKQ
jgi:hypothetical protein